MRAELRDMAMDAAISHQEKESGSNEVRETVMEFVLARLRPYTSITMEYDDNYFQTEKGKKDYLINTVRPGIRFVLGKEEEDEEERTLELELPDEKKKERHELDLDMGVNISTFLSKATLNTQLPYVSLLSRLGRGRHDITFNYGYSQETEVKSVLVAGAEGVVDRNIQTMGAGWETSFNRLGFAVDYMKTDYFFKTDFKESNNLEEQMVSLTGYFKPLPMPKTRFLIEYDITNGVYCKSNTKDNDYDSRKIWLGVKGKLAPKTTGLVKVGYDDKNYKGIVDKETTTAEIDLTHKYSSKTELLFKYKRETEESPRRSEGYKDTNKFDLGSSYRLTKRLTLINGIEFTHEDSNTGVTNKIYDYTTKLKFSLRKWLSAYIQYEYEKKDSNVAGGGYVSNVYTFKTEAAF
ncbi:MAG: outer membrane beta-barrel protein [Candidatus Omnitrophica bacterium]|nr:outer membrane beta-barrel protein [Candidatus Omnitrophota bacterium]